jgi:hypothetical protein
MWRSRAAIALTFSSCNVPCHNDLLAGNMIDDGERIWLIDYEYSGNNAPCFELGNIWAECQLTLDGLAELAGEYYGGRRRGCLTKCSAMTERPAPPAPLPSRARVVIIGGGVIGTSVAYPLAGLGHSGPHRRPDGAVAPARAGSLA